MSIFKVFKRKNESIKDAHTDQNVMKWVKKNKKYLNVVSIPYNNSLTFLEIILELIRENKKVLYITNQDIKDISLLKQIRTITSFRSYCYFRGNYTNLEDKLLIITNYDSAYLIKDNFYCVIYDDISCYSEYQVKDIKNLIYKIKSEKYIVSSIEPVLEEGDIIEVTKNTKDIPIIEPRIITTKIDTNKEMPYMIYDYMKWFVKSRRKVILYAPDKQKADKIYKQILHLREDIRTSIIRYSESNVNIIKKRLKIRDEPIIIVIDNMNTFHMEVNNLDIIVYFADDERYDYKKLTYICGKVGMKEGFSNSEVIFLANNFTLDMEKAKTITRNFNKVAWEKGLVNI